MFQVKNEAIQLQDHVFQFGAYSVRVAGSHESPLFCAADVCAALGLAGGARNAVSKLDQDETELVLIQSTPGRKHAVFVNESGLYSLILGSNKAEAKAFRKWVTSEVLPAIRKQGFYSLVQDAARKQVERMLTEHFPPALLPTKAAPIFRDLILAVNDVRREPRARLNPAWARMLANLVYGWALDVPGQQEHRRARHPDPNDGRTDHSLFSDVAHDKVRRVMDHGILLARSCGSWAEWKRHMQMAFSREPLQLPLMVALLDYPRQPAELPDALDAVGVRK